MWLDEGIALVAFLFIPIIVTSSIDLCYSEIRSSWYRSLRKPIWVAPNYVFQSVWIFLLLSMGIASYIVWKNPHPIYPEKSFLPLLLYTVLLGLTWVWTPIFFSMKSLTASLVIVAVLIPTADFCVYLFMEVNLLAGLLLTPLPLWLIYIAYLNFTLYYINQECLPC